MYAIAPLNSFFGSDLLLLMYISSAQRNTGE